MQQLIFLVLAAGIGLAVFKLRGDAAKERKAVLSRLEAERDLHGGNYSPTAELFREVGVPMVTTANGAPTFERLSDLQQADAFTPAADDLDELPAPTGAPAIDGRPQDREQHSTPGDIRALLRGIKMPAVLRPLGPLSPHDASFVAHATSSDEVRDRLERELGRLGCDHRWVTPTTAEIERNGERGEITIDAGTEPGAVVVRMLGR